MNAQKTISKLINLSITLGDHNQIKYMTVNLIINITLDEAGKITEGKLTMPKNIEEEYALFLLKRFAQLVTEEFLKDKAGKNTGLS